MKSVSEGALMPDTTPVPWRARDVALVPQDETRAEAIVELARQLTRRETAQLVQAYSSGAYEIAATYVWTRTMSGLKRQLASLGLDFIGEMLDRTDLRADADVHEVLTDYDAVRLAEQLGMFGSSHARRLRQTLETIAYFADPPDDADEEGMTPEEAVGALRTCVQTVLGHEELSVAVEFAGFRRSLESEVLDDDSPAILAVADAPYFYKRTVLRVMIAGAKTLGGARLENMLANLNIVLPILWPELMDPDKYMLGRAYAELHADGQTTSASGVRSALLKVAGFDFVPESLRSRAFLDAASRVQDAHFGWDNFHNEPAPMRVLASLGSSIPVPAFARCMTAILCVRIGNPYGLSHRAQPDAAQMLRNVTVDRWEYFFNDCLPADDVLLGELLNSTIAGRWCDAFGELPRVGQVKPKRSRMDALLNATTKGDARSVASIARQALAEIEQS